jgi:hypothetical protein
MRNKNKNATVASSGVLDPKHMRLVGTRGFDVLDDKCVAADAQEEIYVRPADGQGCTPAGGGASWV